MSRPLKCWQSALSRKDCSCLRHRSSCLEGETDPSTWFYSIFKIYSEIGKGCKPILKAKIPIYRERDTLPHISDVRYMEYTMRQKFPITQEGRCLHTVFAVGMRIQEFKVPEFDIVASLKMSTTLVQGFSLSYDKIRISLCHVSVL